MALPNESTKILDLDITTAISIIGGNIRDCPQWVKGLQIEANFTYGSGGTSTKAYLQTTFDGTNWIDIACFAFTTTSGRRIFSLNKDESITTILTPTDGTLTDNTSKDGLLGKKIRIKYVTTGTYVDTNLSAYVFYK